MSDQEHTSRDSEAEPNHDDTQPPQVDQFRVEEPQLVDPDAVELADAEVSPEAVEPELSVSADDVHLVEPSLNPARISEDTARAASLEETAAEARRVEQEALDAGQLVAGTGAASDPASHAAPAGTAPAGGPAGDTDAEMPATSDEAPVADPAAQEAPDGPQPEPAGGPLDSNDVTRSLPSFAAEAEAPQWTPAATDEQRWDNLFDETAHDAEAGPAAVSHAADTSGPDAPLAVDGTGPVATAPDGSSPVANDGPQPEPAGGPYGLPPAGTQATRREGRQDPAKTPRNRNQLIGGVLLGLLALGLLIWGLIALIGGLTASPDREPVANGTPGADGIIAENVQPLDIEEGQCLRDFVDINSESTVVTCSTPHNAQLLATAFYADADEFPGDDALALRAQEVCDGVDIDESTAARYEDLELLRVTPRQGSWSDGDRRVDCLVTSSEGNIISDTLISE